MVSHGLLFFRDDLFGSRLKVLKLTYIIAEDYYGADYPEDEVDEDDEFGVDVYKYRKDASDDEEWDADNAVWSDEEIRKS